MRAPRFIVNSVTGYSATGHEPATSYSVLDTLCNYREVGRFYAWQGAPSERLRLQAYRLAALLNEDA